MPKPSFHPAPARSIKPPSFALFSLFTMVPSNILVFQLLAYIHASMVMESPPMLKADLVPQFTLSFAPSKLSAFCADKPKGRIKLIHKINFCIMWYVLNDEYSIIRRRKCQKEHTFICSNLHMFTFSYQTSTVKNLFLHMHYSKIDDLRLDQGLIGAWLYHR